MTKMRKTLAAMTLCVPVVFSISGCTHATDGQATSNPTSAAKAPSSRPTLTASALQPPPQHNQYTTQGRSEVVFDPCTWIGDDTVRKSGFDPSTRKRRGDMVAEYSFLSCEFSSDTEVLTVSSGNVSWDDDLKKVGSYSNPTKVNDRPALVVHNPKLPDECQVDVKTKVGFVQITLSPGTWSSDPVDCNRAMTIASNIEKEIGKDN
ncbi:DUF3558 domain-containing protein [Nocardia veterana]|uniref:DUF3558 domain-containing protein n=1 Tax=Nocardia veterana TaxID=132249 RepID=A0A7X6M3D0_9NOCA|nr:DUF3558 domain-containing protein [Nocardia veterana]NKY89623.1 DUF3558 domain-containing protein [Nocardia veterana]